MYGQIDGEDGQPGYFTRGFSAKVVLENSGQTLRFVYDDTSYGTKGTDWFSVAEAEAHSSYDQPPWYICRNSVTQVIFDSSFSAYRPKHCGCWFLDFAALMRQRLKESFGVGGKGVYVSLDDLWFSTHGIRDAIAYFESHGYTHVFIDEVHHFGKDWSLLIKNIYDQFPGMNFVYSGSSLLKIEEGQGDLARRQGSYVLKGLSFREFLAFEGVLDVPPLTLEEVIGNHRKIAQDIVSSVRVLPLFEKYLECGYYPFYKEPGGLYQQRLRAIVSKVLESDWPAVEDVSVETVRKAKKMLMILASSVPQSPNMSRLYQQLETERNTGLKILGALDRGALLALVPPKGENLKNLSKPAKIYCDNTNMMYALTPRANRGTARETFFYNQVRKDHAAVFSGVGDFLVDDTWHFEIGGAGKGFDQVKDIPTAYVVNDDTEIGLGNKIPLWLFGFLY